MKIQVIDRAGQVHLVEGTAGQSLMEVLRDLNFMLGSCDGNAACGTCHVFVDAPGSAELGQPGDDESAQLAQAVSFREGSSRLACQIRCAEGLQGIRVTLAPDG